MTNEINIVKNINEKTTLRYTLALNRIFENDLLAKIYLQTGQMPEVIFHGPVVKIFDAITLTNKEIEAEAFDDHNNTDENGDVIFKHAFDEEQATCFIEGAKWMKQQLCERLSAYILKNGNGSIAPLKPLP
jgi:hypothetical protein